MPKNSSVRTWKEKMEASRTGIKNNLYLNDMQVGQSTTGSIVMEREIMELFTIWDFNNLGNVRG